MKRARMLVALLALLALAGEAAAQGTAGDGQQLVPGPSRGLGAPKGNPVGGMVDADTTFRVLRTDASGNVYVVDSDPLTGSNVWTITNGAAGDTTAVHMADSSAVLDTRGYRRFFLRVKIFTAGNLHADSVRYVKLAFQFRNHAGGLSDTVSTYPWTPLMKSGAGVTSSHVDSSVTVGLVSAPATRAAAGGVPHSNEVCVILDLRARGDVTSQSAWGAFTSAYIPLSTFFGDQFLSDYTSVRWRVLRGLGVVTTNIALVGYEQ